ncbi:MAG: RNA polymerase subunit sigma-54 [uncultured Thiotrichaceae bacterium]|uniref:RNA polymerase subunit sigma-54 n=1 Tax=uncultured Thiotrichaceae bacterium TaxID=298394 RepID=A0A6S6TCX1_9GAMM|nr:MAG: RNA polymerase subunit sigma-54 [uncultured Thiotrichaceae bacterium]
MQLPLRITFHQMETSPALEEAIREKVAKLEQVSKNIISCRVSVEESSRHNQQGTLFHVVIDLEVPEAEIVVSREKNDKQEHEDVYVALRDAFNSARRQLKEYESRRKCKVKRHSLPAQPEPEVLGEAG